MDIYYSDTISFIDIETPNEKNDKVCSLGIITTKDNEIAFQKHYLINPDCTFSDTNIKIHGISPIMVKDMPKFPEVWKEIEHFFINGIIIAHNALFDIPVICKTLSFYRINVPDINYFCTMQHSKGCGHLSNKLIDLCNEYEIEIIEHHNAMYDAMACKELFYALQNRFSLPLESNVKHYSFNTAWEPKVSGNILTKALNELKGIVYGLVCDKAINQKEISAITHWLFEYELGLQFESGKALIDLIKRITEDEAVTLDEIEHLSNYISSFKVNSTDCLYKVETCAMQELMGIVQGIIADDVLNELEIKSLLDWQTDHFYLSGDYPFDKIYYSLQIILQDGVITQYEKDELIEMFRCFTNPNIHSDIECDLTFNDQTFCLSGNFLNGSKSDIEKLIIDKGGIMQSSVTKKLNYLIVGGSGSQDWKYGNYGTKVNKALELKENGCDLEILTEETLFNKLA